MAKNTYGVGIVGAGFMGNTHSYNYINMPIFYDNLPCRTRLLGICDSDLAKAEKLKESWGFEFATDKYADLIGRADVNIIDVCTPTIFHYQQIVAAIQAGKHVYVDKPLSASPEEADRLVRIAESADTAQQVAYHYRFYPAIIKAKALIDDGFLGKPLSYRTVYYHSSNLNPGKPMGWKQEKAMGGGGVLIEMACHCLDLMYHLLGEYDRVRMESIILFPERPRSDGTRARVQGEDHVLLTIRMKNGMLGTAEVSKVMVGSNDDLNFEIYGTEGAIRFKMMQPNFLWVYDGRDTSGHLGGTGYRALETINKYPESTSNFPGPRFPIGWLRGHVACQHNFLKCAHQGTPASPSFKEAAYTQRIIEEIYSSQRALG